ncbi:spore coat associated protein CotJA [Alicyclobacillus hesperidum]|uniref:spore coat associated protein CotJA n=1 Tax=Alicyclobacillus hesperidum TaxID=89784 RepID=UPI000942340A
MTGGDLSTVEKTPSQWRVYRSYHSPFDPCSPRTRYFNVPPNVLQPFQTSARKQFAPHEALRKGTLWPEYYSPYPPETRGGEAE